VREGIETMGTTAMPQRDTKPLIQHRLTGEPGEVAVTVIACLVLLLVFIVIAALV
jgi:hypothetical protein